MPDPARQLAERIAADVTDLAAMVKYFEQFRQAVQNAYEDWNYDRIGITELHERAKQIVGTFYADSQPVTPSAAPSDGQRELAERIAADHELFPPKLGLMQYQFTVARILAHLQAAPQPKP